eukprot:jgi/Chrzof1/6379/Cz18g08050.t1
MTAQGKSSQHNRSIDVDTVHVHTLNTVLCLSSTYLVRVSTGLSSVAAAAPQKVLNQPTTGCCVSQLWQLHQT